MTNVQHGAGTTPERAKRGKIETTETIHAGEIAQRERWPDIVAFMLDEGMLTADDGYGWDDYCRLRHGMAGCGSGGEGWKQQEWIRFQKIVGYMHLRALNELWDYPVPTFGNDKSVAEAKWRLNGCMHLTRKALSAASEAAQEARMEVEGCQRAKNNSTHPESL